MPKRDENYMRAQRDALARAALAVLLEKGYYEATSREICIAAEISNGALYNHFPTREAVVVAASALALADDLLLFMPASWADYLDAALRWQTQDAKFVAKRFRLQMQFAAERAMMDRNPDGLTEHLRQHRQHLGEMLQYLKDLGVITLPLGRALTSEIHAQIAAGAEYYALSNHDADRALTSEALETAFAMTAGLVAGGEPEATGRSAGPSRTARADPLANFGE